MLKLALLGLALAALSLASSTPSCTTNQQNTFAAACGATLTFSPTTAAQTLSPTTAFKSYGDACNYLFSNALGPIQKIWKCTYTTPYTCNKAACVASCINGTMLDLISYGGVTYGNTPGTPYITLANTVATFNSFATQLSGGQTGTCPQTLDCPTICAGSSMTLSAVAAVAVSLVAASLAQ